MERRRQLFNENGFFSKEGVSFVNERFSKELDNLLSTADTKSDVEILSALLKSMVDNRASKIISSLHEVKNEKAPQKEVPPPPKTLRTVNAPFAL